MKRVTVSDESFNNFIEMASKMGITTGKQNDRASKLLDGVLLDSYYTIEKELKACKTKVQEVESNATVIDEVQSKRIKKLQTLGFLDEDISKTLEELLDGYIEMKADDIKASVEKI